MLDVDSRQKRISPIDWPAALRLESMTVAAPAATSVQGWTNAARPAAVSGETVWSRAIHEGGS